MARIKLAYVGGGSSRAAGTMASFLHHGSEFDGDHLEIVRTIADKMARNAGLDITITATTDQREGLTDVDAVLTSFRPGGFEMRLQD
jgi:6-phospho-beta-glucosidase